MTTQPTRPSHNSSEKDLTGLPQRRRLFQTLGKLNSSVVSTRPDWVVVAIPTALAIKALYSPESGSLGLFVIAIFALVNGALLVVAYLRPVEKTYSTRLGPFVVLCVASGIVITRPSGLHNAFTFFLVCLLAYRLAKTVDSRVIISSLIDGLGLYALVNVLFYAAGLRSRTEEWRLGLDSGGVDRIIYPFSNSVNLSPVLAAVYIVAVFFVIREPGRCRRLFRLACFAAAVSILWGGGTRVPAVVAFSLPIIAVAFPRVSRWLASAIVVLASLSAILLPALIESLRFVLQPILSFVTNRSDSYASIGALNGRDYIWESALEFWEYEVDSPLHILFGYGLEGHYYSGASGAYVDIMAHVILRNPEKSIHLHNSFLQQLYDGGIAGWILLTVGLLFLAARSSTRLRDLGTYGLAMTTMLTALLICSMTEVLLSPNVNLIPFWVLIVLAGAVCQVPATVCTSDGVPQGRPERADVSGTT
ncbi:O-antigen ligase family protein [Mycolicibacterium elephantis]|uniref:O-antigen ligase family protein n=1 Tax=Mycolicibacterium elephantis TaxID=81858 RepID=UPI0026CA7820